MVTKMRPVLMNAVSVNAILKLLKTKTRRVMNPQPVLENGVWRWRPRKGWDVNIEHVNAAMCPHGNAKDHLWVRETWAPVDKLVKGYNLNSPEWVMFRADGALWNSMTKLYSDRGALIDPPKWKPSIFMPRWACRLTLEIVSVRVERVQDIAPDDCEAEGITGVTRSSPVRGQPYESYMNGDGLEYNAPRDAFCSLWDSINEKRGYEWVQNPWVYVIEFRLLKGAANGNNDHRVV